MAAGRIRRLIAFGATWATLVCAGIARAETPVQVQQDFRDAQFVQVTLGQVDQEAGVHLVGGQPDGLAEPLTDDVGRRSLPNPNQPGADHYFYFDVHDTYIHGGINQVVMTVTYLDRGLTPIVLEYDAYDPMRPNSTVDAVSKKRIPIVTRTNSESWKTERVSLDDARFSGAQPGQADFRIGSSDELVLRNVSVLRVAHEEPPRPIRVVLDGREIAFDVVPWIDPDTGRTLVPMRALLNALGVPDSAIKWDGTARQVEARKGQTLIALTIDSGWAQVNYAAIRLDQPAVIKADRTLVPLRFVSEQFGLAVSWDGVQRLITLTSPPSPKLP